MVWLVPFAFFISLAANDSVLPFGSGGPYQGYVRSGMYLEDFFEKNEFPLTA